MVRTRAIGVRSLPRQTGARDSKNRSSIPRPRGSPAVERIRRISRSAATCSKSSEVENETRADVSSAEQTKKQPGQGC